jgi:butyrate kinase
MRNKILIINPGSTTTKIAVFSQDEKYEGALRVLKGKERAKILPEKPLKAPI